MIPTLITVVSCDDLNAADYYNTPKCRNLDKIYKNEFTKFFEADPSESLRSFFLNQLTRIKTSKLL